MAKCFVIQKFDEGGPYDKRYKDVLKPAIEAAGLEPYRVDEDPGTTVLIDDIEKGIREADICLADISTNNPNVWFEVGYALANGRPVVMICAEPRTEPYPFDIQHRHIIKYTSHSPSDFARLSEEVTARLKAQVKKAERVQTAAAISEMQTTEGLSGHEIGAMATLMSDWTSPESGLSTWSFKEEMRKAGYTAVAAGLSMESLRRKGMIEFYTESSNFNEVYTACRLTEKGLEWMLANQDRFYMTKAERAAAASASASTKIEDEDIPF